MVARDMPFSRLAMHSANIDEPHDFLVKPEAHHYGDMATAMQHYQMHQQPMQIHHQPVYYELTPPNGCVNSTSSYGVMAAATRGSILNSSVASSGQRKRKGSSYQASSEYDDDTGDDSTRTNDDGRKQNHSEIEKRRRDKLNTYITELSSMVPTCHAMSRKLDKLTVLRMAVQHLKTIRKAVPCYTEGIYKPSFLSDQELKMLILQAVDGFLFVVGCDRGRILYASESVSKILNYTQGDLLGQNWFDILHPKDVAKVKEQLSSSDIGPRERLIDVKTMLPVPGTNVIQGTHLCPGARRSFYCRMKCKAQLREEDNQTWYAHRRKKQQASDRKYVVIHFTGYLKSSPAKTDINPDVYVEMDNEQIPPWCNLSCLVAVGRVTDTHLSSQTPLSAHDPPVPPIKTPEFISRHTMDGKFIFVDQRVTLVLGFLPQELLGTSMYEYYHPDDITSLAEAHKTSLMNGELIKTASYRFRTKSGVYINLQSKWKSLKNPWTKDMEYLISKNSVIVNLNGKYCSTIKTDAESVECSHSKLDYNKASGRYMDRLINTRVESNKIGSGIAGAVLEEQRRLASIVCPASSSVASRSDQPTASAPATQTFPHLPARHSSNYTQMNVISSSTHSVTNTSLSDDAMSAKSCQTQPRSMSSVTCLPQAMDTTALSHFNHVESGDIVLASAANGVKTPTEEDMLEMINMDPQQVEIDPWVLYRPVWESLL